MSGTASIDFDALFDADFLSALTRLNFATRRVHGNGRHGERVSKERGAGLQFSDYRAYTPGDDLRAIDWNIWSRLGKLSLRVFDIPQDLPLYLMPDVSGSLFAESPPRIVFGLRATLALAAIGLHHHDSAGLFPFAAELRVVLKSSSGKTQVMNFARHLAKLAQDGAGRDTRLASALRSFASLRLRPGLLLILSDFFDAEGLEALSEALTGVRHRVVLVQLTRRTDGDPSLEGDVRLYDSESGAPLDITITPEVLERYRAAYREFNEQLEALAKARQAALLRLDVEGDLVRQLANAFESGVLAR